MDAPRPAAPARLSRLDRVMVALAWMGTIGAGPTMYGVTRRWTVAAYVGGFLLLNCATLTVLLVNHRRAAARRAAEGPATWSPDWSEDR